LGGAVHSLTSAGRKYGLGTRDQVFDGVGFARKAGDITNAEEKERIVVLSKFSFPPFFEVVEVLGLPRLQ
jgi:hypothetical protein